MNAALKQHVIGQKAHFRFYRMGSLWYETDSKLMFEVPCNETDNGIFNTDEKAVTLIKWINKQLDRNDEARLEVIHD